MTKDRYIRTFLFFILLLISCNSLFSQENFPTNNIQLWLIADSAQDISSSRIWNDYGVHSYLISSPEDSVPTINNNAINSHASLVFDGNKTYLNGGDILDLANDSWTWFVVAKMQNSGYYFSKVEQGNNTDRYWISYNNLMYGSASISTTTFKSANFAIFCWENDRNTNTNTIYKNGNFVIDKTFTTHDFQNTGSFRIGTGFHWSYGTLTGLLKGEIAEIIAFDTLNDSLRYIVNEYLVNKYFPELNIQVNLGDDINIPYGFCDTTINASNSNFSSYQWSTGENSPTININHSGIYSVTVTNSVGLTSSDQVNVTYITPSANQLNDTILCSGNDVEWISGLNDNFTYSWLGSSETTPDITISQAGQYALTVTDSLGCTFSTDTINVSIDDYELSTVFGEEPAHSIDASLCSGNQIGINTNIEQTISYLWNNGSTTPKIFVTEDGTYSVTTTNINGCSAVNSANVTIVGEAPDIAFSVENMCLGDSTKFIGNASSPQGIASYKWIIGNDTINDQNFSKQFDRTGNFSIKTIVESNASCRNESTFEIRIKEIPYANFSYTPLCSGVEMDFINSSYIPDGTSAESYYWIFDGDTIGYDADLTYTFNASSASSFELSLLTFIDNGCSNDTTISLDIRNGYTEPRYTSLVYPTNNILISDSVVEFTWNTDEEIRYYELQIADNPQFTNYTAYRSTTNSYNIALDNLYEQTYWKVTAYNHCLDYLESEQYEFKRNSSNFIYEFDELQLWLRADSVEMENEKISQWYDLSLNSYVFEQTVENEMPSISHTSNNLPILSFNGSNYLSGGNILNLGLDSWSWFIVSDMRNSGYYFSKVPIDNSTDRYWFSYNNLMFGSTSVSTSIFKTPTLSIFCWENDRELSKNIIYKNGIESINNEFSNSHDFQNQGDFRIGSGFNKSTGILTGILDGEIAEIIAFSTVNDSLRNNVNTYLVEKYFPEHYTTVSLGYDIHVPYGFCDTAITTAYQPDFISYQWSTGETDSVIHVNHSGTYSVTVTNNFGVTSTDKINVYFPEINQISDTTLCYGDTIEWNLKLNPDDYTFEWFSDFIPESNTNRLRHVSSENASPESTNQSNTASGADLQSVTSSNMPRFGTDSPQLSISTAGYYYCVITDSLGCSFTTDTIHISIDDYENTAGFVSADTSLCIGNRLTIDSNLAETATFSWNNGSTDSDIILSAPGTYSVTTTNFRGCKAQSSINVNINGTAPHVAITTSGNCQNEQIILSDNSTSPSSEIISWKWSVNNNEIATSQNTEFSFGNYGINSISLYITTSDNCHNDTTITTYIHPLPHIDMSAISLCQNSNTTLIARSSIQEGNIAQNIWLANNTTLTGDTTNIIFAEAGRKNIMLKSISAENCADSANFNISILSAEKPIIETHNVCKDAEAYFIDRTAFSNINPPISWHWDFGDGKQSSQQNPTHIYDTAGSYQTSLTIKYENQCVTSANYNIEVHKLPQPIIAHSSACVGEPFTLSANTLDGENIISYNWKVADIYESDLQTPNLKIDSAGSYLVKLHVESEYSCRQTSTDTIEIYDNPKASFGISRNWGGTPLFIEFENTSSEADSYLWYYGNTLFSEEENPSFIFTTEGDYVISLISTNEFGCSDTATLAGIRAVEPVVDLMLIDLSTAIENGFMQTSVYIINNGTLDIPDISLELTLNDGQKYLEHIGDIVAGEIKQHIFSTLIPVPGGVEPDFVCVKAFFADINGLSDINPDDNIICRTKGNNLTAFRPYPVPAADYIYCDISTKVATDVKFEIFSSKGTLMHTYTYKNVEGYLQLSADVSSFATGAYQLRISTSDEVLYYNIEIAK